MVSREQSLELVRNFAHNYGLLLKFVCDLAGKYRECYDDLVANQSQHYHINVIEELHINENGHSRILCKLLQYRAANGKYVFLESLIEAIGKIKLKPAFSGITISNPKITQEKKRIDLWVRDYESGYAIIFENKVYNAADQDAQIYRYIQETENDGFAKGSIFVVYMPETEKDPDKCSWGDEKNGYEQNFAERYVCFSFKENISKWVKDTLESKIIEWKNETILHSALHQYSHFLDTLYNKQESNMLQSLESVIKSSLSPDFDKKPVEEQIKILSDYIFALESLASENDETLAEKTDKNKAVLDSLLLRLNALLDRYILAFCKTSSVQITNERPNVNLQILEDGYITLALPAFKGVSNDLTLSIKAERSNTYIQLTSKSGNLNEISAFDNLLKSKTFTDSNKWNYWKVVDFSPSNIETIIEEYKIILDRILGTKYWKA